MTKFMCKNKLFQNSITKNKLYENEKQIILPKYNDWLPLYRKSEFKSSSPIIITIQEKKKNYSIIYFLLFFRLVGNFSLELKS